ncbi:hypothetical protein BDV93DRAFT_602808 [Ceratobasidium sp. AG-I]|nr:hypothetical protein BDV93DRAFT_602808 [Ceratobasidium sp. AG-I]
MPMFIVTTFRYDKPLPSLPRTEERRRPSSLVLPDTSSTYSRTSSTRSKSRPRYELESEGSISSQASSSSPRSSISVPSILKPSRAPPENRATHRKTERKTVRFLPIIDSLLRYTLRTKCIAHDIRFPPHSARLPTSATPDPLGFGKPGGRGALYLTLCERTRTQPAVSPPITRMWIVSYEFPWVVEVIGTGRCIGKAVCHCPTSFHCKDRGKTPETFVTIFDVLHALWANLQKPIMESEWTTLSSSERRRMRRTCIDAYANEPSRSMFDIDPTSNSLRSRKIYDTKPRLDSTHHLRRIDWLGALTCFGGLIKDEGLIAERIAKPHRREATWALVLEQGRR